ncbi:HNH endonuclease [Streptomyces iakyrus]|uniref:HNH endonuclease n=1 Tax=Streptomyces iakyrus TaxID=68219 RepID=UPI0036EF96E0
MNEKWRAMERCPKYEVSNTGSVRHRIRRKRVKFFTTKKGYQLVSLGSGDGQKTFRVHRLVAEAFIPNPLKKPQVNHIDANPSNNIVDNLEWVTDIENKMHRLRLRRGHVKQHDFICRKIEEDFEAGLIA